GAGPVGAERRGRVDRRRDHLLAHHPATGPAAWPVLRHRCLLRLPGRDRRRAAGARLPDPGCPRDADRHRSRGRTIMTRAAPVVVVGAGPAGLTAAIELASAALPVVLIDAG